MRFVDSIETQGSAPPVGRHFRWRTNNHIMTQTAPPSIAEESSGNNRLKKCRRPRKRAIL